MSDFSTGSQVVDEGIPMSDLSDPIPEGVPSPALYRMLVMPIDPNKSLTLPGGHKLLLPTQTQDAETWNNMICRVVKLGPLCFKHRRYADMGMTEPPIAEGDLIMITARVPFRFEFKGKTLFVVSDDQYFATIEDEESVKNGSFRFSGK